jgi:hypothetical protein
MSNMVLLMTMRRMKSRHNARFSVGASGLGHRTNFAREVCEVALAHIVKDKSEASYRRELLERRRELMTAWAGVRCRPRSRSDHSPAAGLRAPQFRVVSSRHDHCGFMWTASSLRLATVCNAVGRC